MAGGAPKVVGRAPDPGGTHLATSPSSRAVVVGRDGEEAEGGRASRSGVLYVKTRKVPFFRSFVRSFRSFVLLRLSRRPAVGAME